MSEIPLSEISDSIFGDGPTPAATNSIDEDTSHPVAWTIGLLVRGFCVIVPMLLVVFLIAAGVCVALLAVLVGHACHKIDGFCEWLHDDILPGACQWLRVLLWGIAGSNER